MLAWPGVQPGAVSRLWWGPLELRGTSPSHPLMGVAGDRWMNRGPGFAWTPVLGILPKPFTASQITLGNGIGSFPAIAFRDAETVSGPLILN